MKLKIGQSRIEADFEYFVRALPALEPVEFCGLAKVLCVEMTYPIDWGFNSLEEMKEFTHEELKAKVEATLRPLDEIMEEMMDKYLSLNKRRRGEINGILKDIKRSKKNEVTKNGTTT